MENKDSFDITLCGTLPLKHLLKYPIDGGKYEVGLRKVIFPKQFKTLGKCQFSFRLSEGEIRSGFLRAGFYPSYESLIGLLNRQINSNDIKVMFDAITRKVYISTAEKAMIQFSSVFAKILKLPSGRIRGLAESSFELNGDIFDPLLVVRANFVASETFNDRERGILHVTRFESRHAGNCAIHYKDLAVANLTEIGINITDEHEKNIDFLGAKVCVQLHFRART